MYRLYLKSKTLCGEPIELRIMVVFVCIFICLGYTSEDVEAFLSEIEMMKKVSNGNNPHIVKMLGCVTSSTPAILLLEYVPHGNLRDYLRKYKPTVSRL